MKRKIVVDSSANMRAFKGVDFQSVPLKIITADREYVDDANLDVLDMAQALSTYKGKSSTACPGVGDYLDAFGDAEEVFCVTIISTLSGSYNAAMTAASQYMEEHPGRKVYVLDSYSAGPELKLLVEKIYEGIVAEKDFDTICKETDVYKEKNTALIFCLETMKKMGYHGGQVIVDHCNNLGAAQALKDAILAEYKDAKVRIEMTMGLCSFYAEKGGLMIGFVRN